jgi:quaternary ammonium compound-resistance protein SugE
MAWVYLLLAGLCEVAFAATLKPTQGLTKPLPTAIFLISIAASFAFLALATREIPVGTAYAVWCGIGILGAALVGILLYHEPANALRLVFLATLLVSIIGLKFATPT